eukprot:gene7077-12717_t
MAKDLESSGQEENLNMEDIRMKLNLKRNRYPYSIVWTPIPCLTWIFPFIGHMGIAMSSGVIRDFAGPYFVSEDDMAFGNPTKYWQLNPTKVCNVNTNWDNAVSAASEEYKKRMLWCSHQDMVTLFDPDSSYPHSSFSFAV